VCAEANTALRVVSADFEILYISLGIQITTFIPTTTSKCSSPRWPLIIDSRQDTNDIPSEALPSAHLSQSRSRSYFTTDGQSVSQYVLVLSTLVALATRYYYFLSDSRCLVSVGRPL
jgi:hypothetical protein